jgi:antirestriction protein ArdC
MSNNKVLDPIIDAVIDALSNGRAPWAKPWAAYDGGASLPYNVVSRKPYRGLNVLILGCTPYTDPRWGTFAQWKSKGGTVRKGQKCTYVTFWKFLEVTKAGAVLPTDTDTIPIVKTYAIFNAEQIEGIAPLPAAPVDPAAAIIAADAEGDRIATDYLTREKIPLSHVGGGAWYMPSGDRVNVPPIGSFVGTAEYYSTLFHEMVHSTGHGTRLNRPGITGGTFGSEKYAVEELVAEMGASILLATAGLAQPAVTSNSIAYLAGWADKIKADRGILLKAASASSKAVDLVLNVKHGAADTDATE